MSQSWIDWELSARTAISLVPPGPRATRGEITQAVTQLQTAAAQAPDLVAPVSHLEPVYSSETYVVDRPTIITTNTQTIARMFAYVGLGAEPDGLVERLSGGALGAGAGTALAVLATRILGQFDAFAPTPRLLLVAPNIITVERDLKVVPGDFRLWVCLHEQTHRMQFAHAHWLKDYILTQMRALVDLDAQSQLSLDELPERIGRVQELRRTAAPETLTSVGLLSAISGPETGAIIDRVTAVMSLLEGHADLIMDEVGPKVIPTLPKIRKAFNSRRTRGGLVGVVGKLLGLDAKLAQYSDGAAFCRAVLSAAGMDGLNLAFRSAADLPSIEELYHPEQWLTRLGLAGGMTEPDSADRPAARRGTDQNSDTEHETGGSTSEPSHAASDDEPVEPTDTDGQA